MSDTLIVTNKDKTTKGYLDLSRPPAMNAADNIYPLIAGKQGETSGDAVAIAQKLSVIFQDPKNTDPEKLWQSISKSLFDGKPLPVKAKGDEDKILTAFGLFYGALNQIDATANTTKDLQNFQSAYLKARSRVTSRFLAKETGIKKINLQRAINTIDKRLRNVIARYNIKVTNDEVAGPKL